MTPEQATEAAYLRLALDLNLIAEAQIGTWLDSVIMGSSAPEPALIDAALVGLSRTTLYDSLGPLTAGPDFARVNNRVATLLLPKAGHSVQAAQALSHQLYEAHRRGTLVLPAKQLESLQQASSMFDVLEIQAWGTFAEAKATLVSFLHELLG